MPQIEQEALKVVFSLLRPNSRLVAKVIETHIALSLDTLEQRFNIPERSPKHAISSNFLELVQISDPRLLIVLDQFFDLNCLRQSFLQIGPHGWHLLCILLSLQYLRH